MHIPSVTTGGAVCLVMIELEIQPDNTSLETTPPAIWLGH